MGAIDPKKVQSPKKGRYTRHRKRMKDVGTIYARRCRRSWTGGDDFKFVQISSRAGQQPKMSRVTAVTVTVTVTSPRRRHGVITDQRSALMGTTYVPCPLANASALPHESLTTNYCPAPNVQLPGSRSDTCTVSMRVLQLLLRISGCQVGLRKNGSEQLN